MIPAGPPYVDIICEPEQVYKLKDKLLVRLCRAGASGKAAKRPFFGLALYKKIIILILKVF